MNAVTFIRGKENVCLKLLVEIWTSHESLKNEKNLKIVHLEGFLFWITYNVITWTRRYMYMLMMGKTSFCMRKVLYVVVFFFFSVGGPVYIIYEINKYKKLIFRFPPSPLLEQAYLRGWMGMIIVYVFNLSSRVAGS